MVIHQIQQSLSTVYMVDIVNNGIFGQLEIAVGHQPFFDQFQDLADQN